jgi:arylsulfatase
MHIILYVMDALRPDHLGCYGYDRPTSPYIDRIAREGVVFENCFTSSTWTRPVAASVLSGTYPAVHRTYSRHDAFFSNVRRLPEVLTAAGFKTAAFSTMGNIASEIGFDRGFDRYHDLFRDPRLLDKRPKLRAAEEGLMHALDEAIALPRAEDINHYLFPWLAEHREADTFSFVWSIETHEPYRAPDAFCCFSEPSSPSSKEGMRDDIRSAGAPGRQRLMDLYDNEVYYSDHCIGQIISHLKDLNLYSDTLLLLVSDHGDAFYEHGFYTHGHAPYEELIHVPLIIKFPGGHHAGQRIEGLAELIDILPTILAVTGLDPGGSGGAIAQGHNLLPLVSGSSGQLREHVFSDTRSLKFGNRYLSVRGKRWKYIQVRRPKPGVRTLAGTVQHVRDRHMLLSILRSPRHYMRPFVGRSRGYLFDLQSDPGEQHNLASDHRDLVTKFAGILDGWERQNADLALKVGGDPYSYEESESVRRHLEELGYA